MVCCSLESDVVVIFKGMATAVADWLRERKLYFWLPSAMNIRILWASDLAITFVNLCQENHINAVAEIR